MGHADIGSEFAVGKVVLHEDCDRQKHAGDHYQQQPNFVRPKGFIGAEQFPHADDRNRQYSQHGQNRTVPGV